MTMNLEGIYIYVHTMIVSGEAYIPMLKRMQRIPTKRLRFLVVWKADIVITITRVMKITSIRRAMRILFCREHSLEWVNSDGDDLFSVGELHTCRRINLHGSTRWSR